MLTSDSHITFWHIASSTLDNRLKMSSSKSELTNEMEVESYQFEPEFTEEESESQNLASSVIVSMKEECHWIGALVIIAQFYQHSTSFFVAVSFIFM